MTRPIPKLLLSLLAAIPLPAECATYHVDPVTGSMANNGSAGSPWSTLEAVFSSGRTFAAGDIIYLRSGYHGAPDVRGHNTAAVEIRAETGATPKVRAITFRSGSQWIVTGLDISSENISPASYGGTLVDIQDTASDITVRDCRIAFAADTSGWSLGQWQSRAGNGVFSRGRRTVVRDNTLVNVGFAITLYSDATDSLVSGNFVRNFSMDALRGLADFCVFEDNTVINSVTADSNHDDFFQSWSTDASGNVGYGTVRNVTVRGNIFISSTDPAQPLRNPPQGIGCFDGMFENWVIENNLISTKTYHGISLLGAINCRIVNNTVAENPVDGSSAIQPWIQIYEHKEQPGGSPWPVRSSGNLVRNNICCWGASMPSTAGTIDHNLGTTDYALYYTNFAAFDFYPRPGSPAIGAGVAANAPATDIQGTPRNPAFDAGAFEAAAGARPEGVVDFKASRDAAGTGIVIKAISIPGTNYIVRSSDRLDGWTGTSPTLSSPAGRITWRAAEAAGTPKKFYQFIRQP